MNACLRHTFFYLLLLGLSASGCSKDNTDNDVCNCDFGDQCEEYHSDCSFVECIDDTGDVFEMGECAPEGAIARCTCNDEWDNYVTYYYEDSANSSSTMTSREDDCEFFCDSGVFEKLK